MRLLVLGASNEIMSNGYIRSVLANEVINASSGGCCISAGVMNYLKFEEPEADFALLNFELNEHSIIRSRLRTQLEARQMWDWLLTKLHGKSTRPVVAVLPRIEHGRIVRTSTCDIHKEIALHNNAPFIDLADIFVKANSSGTALEKLMKDNAHLQDEASRIVGNHIGTYLRALLGQKRDTIKVSRVIAEYRFISCDQFVPHRTPILRKTSLMAGRMVKFDQGDAFEIPGKNGDTLLSLSVNRCSMPGATLIFSDRRKGIYFPQAKRDAYMNVVVDFANGVHFQRNQLSIEVGATGIKPSEPTWLSDLNAAFENDFASIELEGALVLGANEISCEVYSHRPPQHLADFATSRDGEALLSALKSL